MVAMVVPGSCLTMLSAFDKGNIIPETIPSTESCRPNYPFISLSVHGNHSKPTAAPRDILYILSPVTVLNPSLMYARGQPGTFISATTIPTDTVSDMVLNISSQNCDEFEFLSRATVLIGGWQAENGVQGVGNIPVVSNRQSSDFCLLWVCKLQFYRH